MDLLQPLLDLQVNVLHFLVCPQFQVFLRLSGLIKAILLEFSFELLDDALLLEQDLVQILDF